jgi:transposase
MDRHVTTAPAAWVGIDFSQHTLDACLLPHPGGKPRTASFANDTSGHAALVAWTDRHPGTAVPGFCLESTGAYGEAGALPCSQHLRDRCRTGTWA